MTDSFQTPRHPGGSSRGGGLLKLLTGDAIEVAARDAVREAADAHRADVEARLSASLAPVLSWIRGAEGHLAALQAQAKLSAELPATSAAVLDWMRGAESHLAALQADQRRLRDLYEARTAQLDQALDRIASLEARLDDVERQGTAIAVAITKARVRQEMT